MTPSVKTLKASPFSMMIRSRSPELLLHSLHFSRAFPEVRFGKVGMAKRVPANLADADTRGGGFDVPSQNALLPAWLPLAVRKYPVAGFSVQTPLPVCPDCIGQTRINRKRKPRGFCLRIADSAVDSCPVLVQVREGNSAG